MEPKLFLKVITRQGVLFDGEVSSVSSINKEGPFDVLRRHTQFISIIKNKLTIRKLDNKIQEIPVDNAVMRVKNELVQVFLGIKQ
ncbi:hypothetical protein A2803_00860 [Candidatus Woesebacteria bacterium RIFCSPHIGHO2_01_FULL_44_21]|uniref:ATP synthase F1 complex delta/epsilon subunit N-terminal domain-containing protein n=1 Tax=Candidatus Woesebacteria bacterium RIFCSPHIGHO2_01_FULL_44_21 TaxID=1802503 RepID=A0A1F7YY15_9BACT|nr:MAG: hypothetical protein A2803_00860 [Candidatus Woesebacteria bacterium RIFCSPHIGHO2_01_FULL_44_21]OGM70052.1 MAG: hypothetical protein A2897_00045 [Candidatus Woesebacteria bacterium RIFCSPLOWO2_01_FULL_44_24b]